MPDFYITIAKKYFFPNFRGHMPPAPVSYACVIPVDNKSRRNATYIIDISIFWATMSHISFCSRSEAIS